MLCHTILSASKVGKDHTAPVHASQILLELAMENTPLLLQRLDEARMLGERLISLFFYFST